MSILALIQTFVFLGKGILASLPKGAQFQVVLDAVGAAVTELEKVTGSDVTKQQLEGLRTTAKW